MQTAPTKPGTANGLHRNPLPAVWDSLSEPLPPEVGHPVLEKCNSSPSDSPEHLVLLVGINDFSISLSACLIFLITEL